MTNNTLEIYSKGLYSSWCYHKPSRTLFDCGEGFASYQGNYIYGIERVMISHGHGDHVLGLPSLIGCRNSARGARDKPLIIYYPHGDTLVESVRDFCNLRNNHLRFSVEWKPIMPGFLIDLDNNQELQSFEMTHQKGNKYTLGYRIIEKRTKLKPEFEGKNIPELLKSGVSRDDLKMTYEANTFAYCLDSFYIDRRYLLKCELAIMDCTFLYPDDRDGDTHQTLKESYDLAIDAGVKCMIAAHFSPRYLYPEIRSAVAIHNNDAYHNHKLPNTYITPVYHNQVLEY